MKDRNTLQVKTFAGWLGTYYVLIVGYTHAMNDVLTVLLTAISIIFVSIQIYGQWKLHKDDFKRFFRRRKKNDNK